jgi:hypothetical protein
MVNLFGKRSSRGRESASQCQPAIRKTSRILANLLNIGDLFDRFRNPADDRRLLTNLTKPSIGITLIYFLGG